MFLIVIIEIVLGGVCVVGAGVGELEVIVIPRRRLGLMVHVGQVQLGGEAALPGHTRPLPHLTVGGRHGVVEVLGLGPGLLEQLGLYVLAPLHELGQPRPGRGDLGRHGEHSRRHNLEVRQRSEVRHFLKSQQVKKPRKFLLKVENFAFYW